MDGTPHIEAGFTTNCSSEDASSGSQKRHEACSTAIGFLHEELPMQVHVLMSLALACSKVALQGGFSKIILLFQLAWNEESMPA